jgi:hypothetical protein
VTQLPLPGAAGTTGRTKQTTQAGHRHVWDAMRFELADGHAWVVETCATCGVVRRYRAFERFWTPGNGEPRR